MSTLSRTIFKISKPIHKYVGLVCLIYFILMGISGVLLNHPSQIRQFSIPLAWMPSSYGYINWNRMALREAVFSSVQPGTVYVCGKSGVWRSHDNGLSFTHLTKGFPVPAYDRDTRCLLLREEATSRYLYAGTRAGLFRCDVNDVQWVQIRGSSGQQMEIVDLVDTGNRVLVLTQSSGYYLGGSDGDPELVPLGLTSDAPPDRKAPLFRFLLKLHDGSILGLPGKLFMDIIALTMVFLAISAIYIWYIPWRKKRLRKRGSKPRFFRFFHKYHLKLGIYTAFFIVVIALTGMFVRPPLLLAIVRYSVPAFLLNGTGIEYQWQHRISKAAYESGSNTLLLATREGFYRGPADGSAPFSKVDIHVPVHGMGVSVMEALSHRKILIGSFSGFYVWNGIQNRAEDLKGNPVGQRNGGRPQSQTGMAGGAIVRDGELQCRADYRRGLLSGPGDRRCFEMPEDLVNNSRLSPWHVLFEIHNGRFFRDWLGPYTWLIVPAGGLVLLINVLTGSFDWLYRKGWLRF